MKWCPGCEQWKERAAFSKDRRRPSGLQCRCKECNKQYRQEHREEIQQYREDNREYFRQYGIDHREEIRAKSAQWYIDNREYRIARSKKYYAEHREEYRERHAAWWREHPEEKREYAGRRRAQECGAEGSFAAGDWERLLDLYDYTCLCCGATDAPLEADHIIPLVKGGAHCITNIQPLCMPCNRQKHTKIVDYRPVWYADCT